MCRIVLDLQNSGIVVKGNVKGDDLRVFYIDFTQRREEYTLRCKGSFLFAPLN